MYSNYHDAFLAGIQNKRKARVSFLSKTTNVMEERIVAPLDFGPLARSNNGKDYYFVWDYTGRWRAHPIPLIPDHVIKLEFLDEDFNPQEFITWNTKKNRWKIPRNWWDLS